MRRMTRASGAIAIAVVGVLLGGVVSTAVGGSDWNSAGGNLQNTRFQANEKTLSVSNVDELEVKWEFTTGGDVSATPAVVGDTVYFPDRAGNLFAVDKWTGQSGGGPASPPPAASRVTTPGPRPRSPATR